MLYAIVAIMGSLHHFNVRLSGQRTAARRCHCESRVSTGRNDDPLLFVKVMQRQLAGLATANAAAPGRMFSAMNVLAFFAKDPRSGVVADDAELFCKLQSELQRRSTAATVSAASTFGGDQAGTTKGCGDIEVLPSGS